MSYRDKLEAKLKSTLRIIKHALAHETKENAEMIKTYVLFSQGKATSEQMDEANEQFKSLLKTLGLGALVVLPFAPITIPAIVKLAEKFDIDLIPQYLKEKNIKEDKATD